MRMGSAAGISAVIAPRRFGGTAGSPGRLRGRDARGRLRRRRSHRGNPYTELFLDARALGRNGPLNRSNRPFARENGSQRVAAGRGGGARTPASGVRRRTTGIARTCQSDRGSPRVVGLHCATPELGNVVLSRRPIGLLMARGPFSNRGRNARYRCRNLPGTIPLFFSNWILLSDSRILAMPTR